MSTLDPKKHNHQQGDDLVAGWLSIADPAALLRFDAEVTAEVTAERVERRQGATDVAWALKKKEPGVDGSCGEFSSWNAAIFIFWGVLMHSQILKPR